MFLRLFVLFMGTLSLRSNGMELKTGDLILQSNPCFLCSMIELEEESPYSHVGVILRTKGKISVFESRGSVREVPLEDFLKSRRIQTSSLVLRSERLELTLDADEFIRRFQKHFEFHSYDPDFLWFNRDEKGEKYYCSELVVKLLSPELPLLPKAMHFEKNREEWKRYFKGNPPDGEPGFSPGDFERSPYFRKVGFI